MITIFSTLKKPNQEPFRVIQENAVASWRQLNAEVILFGDEQHEPGTGRIAQKYGCHYLPVERNRWGTPLIGSLLAGAQGNASHRLLCLVNSDIILMRDWLDALLRVNEARNGKGFVMIGSCYSWDNPAIDEKKRHIGSAERIQFTDGWQKRLSEYVEAACELQPPTGMDFWAYPKMTYDGLDFGPMAIGRYKWDNCMVALPKQKGVPIVDATGRFVGVRQRDNIKFPREDPEAQVNMAWGKGRCAGGRLVNADWKLTDKGLVKV